ncbi:MAG TPA: signal peptidase I [Clostridiales bacterium]|nr:signal peptidase I [Clostridiales bacterium]
MDEIRDKLGRNKETGILYEIWQWIKAILAAVIIALVIRGFVFEPVLVDGPSMEPTLYTGEKLILYKLGSFFKTPERGDIVVVEINQGKFAFLKFLNKSDFAKKVLPTFIKEVDYIKRVIAVEGDIMDINEGYVYINGEKIDEPYVLQEGATYIRTDAITFPYTVPADEIIVLGDNRINSKDSREIGPMPVNSVKGEAVFRLWPFDKVGKLK